jgi:hypothetical protein
MSFFEFLKFSMDFHNYKNSNLEGKLCFWIVFPFSYLKYIYIMNFDTASLREQEAFKDYDNKHRRL